MTNLHPSYFFNLAGFEHRAIFDNCKFVWEVLPKISLYLKNFSLGKIDAPIPEGAFLLDPETISIGKGTVVEPGCLIKGPCIIGQNCTIRHGAYIRGDVITGNNCVIGHDTEVKNSLLLNEAQAAHFAYLGDVVLGNRTNLGAGTKCANLKFNHQKIILHIDGQRIETGLRKMGAIIGDGSQIGCNAVTNPGTLCGQDVQWYPCLNHGGFVPSKHVVRPDFKIVTAPI